MNTLSSIISQTKQRANAFTIVELLVVIGIISVLAVALLVTLNPAEAQRRSRDAKRVRDVNTLQAIIEQHLNDGLAPFCTTAGTGCVSSSVATPNSQPCGTSNWMATDLCTYAKTIPADPINLTGRTCVTGAGATLSPCSLQYRMIMNANGDYEIAVHQEAAANASKQLNDGGLTTGGTGQENWLQIYSRSPGLFSSYAL